MTSQRMSGPILTSVSPATLFSGDEEFMRMKALRSKITDVRRIWQSNDEYVALKQKIRSYVDHESHSPGLVSKITKLLEGYSDWADMDYHRPEKQEQSFTAIELYCSEEGYNLLFGIFNAVLREKETSDEVLLVAAALVELVTIELYNLRLSNIGDPRYENFQGVTFRGMCVSKEMAALYRKAASEPDLSKRSFGVPLGFTSSSTSQETTAEFIKQHPGEDQMRWIIHVHGLDPRLLKKYEEKYPDSVVTSITAMPVGRIAELREKEILLRGAFFHIVRMDSEEKDGSTTHTMQLVAMNANRDHGTELALDEGAKQEQRNFFRDMILASRYEVCAWLARSHSVADSVSYEELAKTALARIDFFDHRLVHGFTPEIPHYSIESRPTWYGDKTGHSFSANFLALRNKFHAAAQDGKWNTVRDIIMGEYEWEAADWFNFQALGSPWRGRSLLHEMGSLGPAETSSAHSPGWEYLVEKLGQCEVWSMTNFLPIQQLADNEFY